MRKTVAFGFVGTVLDYAGRGSQRWSKMASDTLSMPARIVSYRSAGIIARRPLALAIRNA